MENSGVSFSARRLPTDEDRFGNVVVAPVYKPKFRIRIVRFFNVASCSFYIEQKNMFSWTIIFSCNLDDIVEFIAKKDARGVDLSAKIKDEWDPSNPRYEDYDDDELCFGDEDYDEKSFNIERQYQQAYAEYVKGIKPTKLLYYPRHDEEMFRITITNAAGTKKLTCEQKCDLKGVVKILKEDVNTSFFDLKLGSVLPLHLSDCAGKK